MTQRSINRIRFTPIMVGLVGLSLGGCAATVGNVAVFRPDSVAPPPSERAALGEAGTKAASAPDTSASASPRRLTLPSR